MCFTYKEVLEATLGRFGGVVDPLAGLDEGKETDKTGRKKVKLG
jgi:hypothetical protein